MAYTLSMEVDIPEQVLADVMVTAFDANHGACWHWASPSEENWLKKQGDDWFEVKIQESDGDKWTVNWEILQRGMTVIVSRNHSDSKFEYAEKLRNRIQEAIMNDDAGVLDAVDADLIVQLGLWGKLLYS